MYLICPKLIEIVFMHDCERDIDAACLIMILIELLINNRYRVECWMTVSQN